MIELFHTSYITCNYFVEYDSEKKKIWGAIHNQDERKKYMEFSELPKEVKKEFKKNRTNKIDELVKQIAENTLQIIEINKVVRDL